MNDKTEQSLADALRAMATSNSDLYEYERLQLKDAAGTLDTLRAQLAEPIDMVLHCPACGMQHIDAVEELPMPMPGSSFEGSAGWVNPPHRSHLCHGCGHIWRPADVPTNGVEAVKTCGKADSKLAAPTDTLRAQLAEAQRDAEVSKQINRACMELPDDFRIAIELERNAACVYLLQEDEDIGSYDPCEGIARSISAAIDAAKGENHE